MAVLQNHTLCDCLSHTGGVHKTGATSTGVLVYGRLDGRGFTVRRAGFGRKIPTDAYSISYTQHIVPAKMPLKHSCCLQPLFKRFIKFTHRFGAVARQTNVKIHPDLWCGNQCARRETGNTFPITASLPNRHEVIEHISDAIGISPVGFVRSAIRHG